MAAEAELTPTSYIQHHLHNQVAHLGAGSFWTLHVDTFVTALLMGLFIAWPVVSIDSIGPTPERPSTIASEKAWRPIPLGR